VTGVQTCALPILYEEALNYLERLSNSFEIFYTSFETDVNQLDNKVYDLKTRYQNVAGSATRYVCADPECFEKIYDQTPYTGSQFQIDNRLAENIYKKVLEYARIKDDEKSQSSDYFSDVFENDIIGYYRKQVMGQYGKVVKMDIIDALRKEIELTKGEFDEHKQYIHAKKTIDEAKELSKPFLEFPKTENTQPIQACTFNTAIEHKNDPARMNFIASELRNYGAEPTPDEVDEQTIIFYQAMYSIQAHNLSKFASEKVTETMTQDAGAYRKAYMDSISRIKPGKGEMPTITPHIHRDWHLDSKMPDLDDETSKLAKKRLNKAVFRGLVEQNIEFVELNENVNVYRVTGKRPKDLVVSNGTPCDTFYEVFDAFMLNSDLVDDMIRRVETEQEDARRNNKDFKFYTSPFAKKLMTFQLEEMVADPKIKAKLWKDQENHVVNSIFDIPVLYMISGSNNIEEEDALSILDAVIDESYSIIEETEPREYVDQTKLELMRQEFDIFHYNIQNYYLAPNSNVRGLKLFINSILNTLVSRLSAPQAETLRHAIKQFINTLKENR
jgi:hypothetical protein